MGGGVDLEGTEVEKVIREGGVMDREPGGGRGGGQRRGRNRDGKEAKGEVSCWRPGAGGERKGKERRIEGTGLGGKGSSCCVPTVRGESLPPTGAADPCGLLVGRLGPTSSEAEAGPRQPCPTPLG